MNRFRNQSEGSLRENGSFMLCASMLLVAALLYAVAGDAPQTLIVTGGGLLAAVFVPPRRGPQGRAVLYGALAVVAAAVVDVQFFPVEEGRFFILPSEVYAPLLLYLGVGCLVVAQRPTTYAASAANALIVLTLAGNTSGLARSNVRFPASTVLLTQYELLYVFGMVAFLVCFTFLTPRLVRMGWRGGVERGGGRLLRAALLTISFVAVAAGAGGARAGIRRLEPVLGRLLGQLAGRPGRHQAERVVFGKVVNLWRTLPYSSSEDRTPVLRVLSDRSPRYLRGRAYGTYANGRWIQQSGTRALPRRWPDGQQAYTIFERAFPAPSADSADIRRVTLLPAVRHATDVLLTPARGRRFELVAEQVQMDEDGALFHEGWKQQSGCAAFVEGKAMAYPGPEDPDVLASDRYVQHPVSLGPRLTGWLDEFGLGVRERLSDAERIRGTVDALQKRCSYKLGVGLRAGEGDPVVQFLDRRRQGHCELFASAAALLLRGQGVPVRYVTGFVCRERLSKDGWIVRLRDAHAWAEAFDRDARRWVLVEATPAAGTSTRQSERDWYRRLVEVPSLLWERLRSRFSRGDITHAVLEVLAEAGQRIRAFMRRPIGGTFLIVVLLAFVAVHRMRNRRRARETAGVPLEKDLRDVRARLLNLLEREGVRRADSETLAEAVQRAELAGASSPTGQLRRVVGAYQRCRFSAEAADAEGLRELRGMIRTLRKSRR